MLLVAMESTRVQLYTIPDHAALSQRTLGSTIEFLVATDSTSMQSAGIPDNAPLSACANTRRWDQTLKFLVAMGSRVGNYHIQCNLERMNRNRTVGSNIDAFGGNGVYQSAVGNRHIQCSCQRFNQNRTLGSNIEAFGVDVVYHSAAVHNPIPCGLQRLNKQWTSGSTIQPLWRWSVPECSRQPSHTLRTSAIATKTGHLDQTWRLLVAMEYTRVQSDTITYHAAVSACTTIGHCEQTLRLLAAKGSTRVQAETILHNAALSA
mmetsp:Transcript_47252/g.150465  ORF Transcript_47252/g.150465 Transcript_47252/m.150465 type:complete len:263 (-) Transcript_47252:75-863(-)